MTRRTPRAFPMKRGKGNAKPAQPDNRLWSVDMGNGFFREDAGAPPPRLPSESQPVAIDADAIPPVDVPVEPKILGHLSDPAPAVSSGDTERDWRGDYGLGKRT